MDDDFDSNSIVTKGSDRINRDGLIVESIDKGKLTFKNLTDHTIGITFTNKGMKEFQLPAKATEQVDVPDKIEWVDVVAKISNGRDPVSDTAFSYHMPQSR